MLPRANKSTRIQIQKLRSKLTQGLSPSSILATDANGGFVTLNDPLEVAHGGLGVATLTDHSLLVGSGTDAVTALGAATNGQLPIGSTGNDPVLAGITGTVNQITVTNGAGSITLSTPQDINTTSSPTFADLDVTGVLDVDGYMSLADAAAQLNIICHIYKVWEMTAAGDNVFRTGLASNIQAGKTGAADFTSFVEGISTQVQLNNPNTQDWTNQFGLRGISIEVNTEGSTSGTLTGAVGILLDAGFQDSMDVTNYYGIYHDSIFDANSKLVNSYGVYLEDFDKATTLNYAIYTNAGTVRLGDLLTVEGNIYPGTDDTYYLGKNDDDTPFAWKGIILKDQAGTGKYYRLEVSGDALQITDLTD
jgi:hypothetical protein